MPVRMLKIGILSLALLASSGSTARATSGVDRVAARPLLNRMPLTSPYEALEGELSLFEVRLFADAADGRWDEHSLLRAALIASGVHDARSLNGYQKQMAALAAELRKTIGPGNDSDRRSARAVFEFMHGRILTGGYQLDCTDLTLALDQGRFNCVSASVLFNCLADNFGLNAAGLEIPGHAMSRLVLAEETLDVETTCPEWFRLIDDPKKQAVMVERTLGAETAGRSRGSARVVSPVELVATIYYNRGVDFLSEERFADAIGANAKALRLDPSSETARGNLLATLNNWAIALASEERFVEAAQRLDRGFALDPTYATFKANYVHVHHQWAEQHARAGRFQAAMNVLTQAEAKRPNEEYFPPAKSDLCRRWVRSLLESGSPNDVFALFDRLRKSEAAPWGRLALIETEEINRYGLALIEQERFDEAVVILDRALARRPDSPGLSDNRLSAVMRWAQSAFSHGDWAEAIRRTTFGAVPGGLHESLANNVRYGYHHWISELLADGHATEARRVAELATADPFLGGQVDGVIPATVWN